MTAYAFDIFVSSMRWRKKKLDLIDIAKNDFLHCVVLENFTNNPTISSTDDQHFLWVRVTRHR
jgi:hypothetical protein